MSNASYSLYHPRWFRRRVPVWWWLKNASYASFVLREMTSVFVAFVAVLLLGLVRSVAEGPEAYGRFLALSRSPYVLALGGISFLFVLFHSVTWFHLAPKAMAVRLAGKRLPGMLVTGMNYLAWILLSLGVGALLLRR